MQLNTVNVLDLENDEVLELSAFEASDEGREAARDLFKAKVKSRDEAMDEGEIQIFLDDGYYETGAYQLFLIESKDA